MLYGDHRILSSMGEMPLHISSHHCPCRGLQFVILQIISRTITLFSTVQDLFESQLQQAYDFATYYCKPPHKVPSEYTPAPKWLFSFAST